MILLSVTDIAILVISVTREMTDARYHLLPPDAAHHVLLGVRWRVQICALHGDDVRTSVPKAT